MKLISYTIAALVSVLAGYTINEVQRAEDAVVLDLEHRQFTLDEVKPYQTKPPVIYTLSELREKYREAQITALNGVTLSTEYADLIQSLNYNDARKDEFLTLLAQVKLDRFTNSFIRNGGSADTSVYDAPEMREFFGDDYPVVEKFRRARDTEYWDMIQEKML